MGAAVSVLLALAVWGTINDKTEYNIAQKLISLQNCKNPHYKGMKVKYIKQMAWHAPIELGFDDNSKITLPYEQVMNILCE
jgi:hypothetical protein